VLEPRPQGQHDWLAEFRGAKRDRVWISYWCDERRGAHRRRQKLMTLMECRAFASNQLVD
jgi:hypothetical protein